MTDKTDLGDRMKAYEAHETERYFLPMLPVYARIDGRSFSKFTRNMARPYDKTMSDVMIEVTKALVAETHARIGYTQSDEISLCWYPETYGSEIFFAGRIFKMTSSLAALASVHFLREAIDIWPEKCGGSRLPTFDARVFQMPTLEECANAFLWRERDATKNSVSMAAQSVYSHKQLQNKNGSEMQEMLWQKGINFNDYPAFFKRGTFVRRITVEKMLSADELARIPEKHRPTGPVLRSEYQTVDMPPFGTVTNRVGVIFRGEDPVVAKEADEQVHDSTLCEQ